MKSSLALLPVLALAGCSTGDYRLFHPLNMISAVEWHSTVLDVAIMLILILPVTVLIFWFAFRYRKTANAKYDPDWSHSLVLELLVWGVPLIIVGVLGYLSFKTIYEVNPYDPTAVAGAETSGNVLNVDVVTTDWQWLFIYPDEHVASIDELVVPVGDVVKLRLTSTSVTNDFFVPQIAPMIDVMPGMRTKDVFDAPKNAGTYTGFSADFSGAGFSWMQFATRFVPQADFDAWVQNAAASPNALSYDAFQKLAQPTVNEGAKISYFSNVEPQLFEKIVTAADDGVVYPVSDELTKSVANFADKGPASPAAQ